MCAWKAAWQTTLMQNLIQHRQIKNALTRNPHTNTTAKVCRILPLGTFSNIALHDFRRWSRHTTARQRRDNAQDMDTLVETLTS